MNLKCFFGMHRWDKFGGPDNVGSGKFKQKLVCRICRKIKFHIS